MPDLFLIPSLPFESPDETAPPQPPQPPDAAQREQALDTTRSWIVEAPAGSGKTGLLIQRYLKLLADPAVTAPEQVLAITFTNKATAELRERVLLQLEAAARNEAPANPFDALTRGFALDVLENDARYGWELIAQPDRCNIRTIDSLCALLVRGLPILSGQGGRQKPVDDPEPLYTLAAHRTVLELGGPDPALDGALHQILLHRDGDLANTERLIAAMLARRDQWGSLVPLGRQLDDEFLDGTILPRLERALDRAICTALTQLADIIPPDLLEELAHTAASLAHLPGYKDSASPILPCTGRHAAPGVTAEDLPHWRALVHLLVTPSSKTWRRSLSVNHLGFAVSAAQKQQLKDLIATFENRPDILAALCRLAPLPPATYPPDQWQVAKALFRILSRALVELKIVFAQRGECDFSEIALAARTALAEPDADAYPGAEDDLLESALGYNLQHLLVDEMQDTSSLQYQLVERLTHGWDGRSQTLFLVGDPKQSIYLFRQARVERFLHTLNTGRLGELTLGALRLTANFRSQAVLVEQFNADFAHIFPSHAQGYAQANPAASHSEAVLFVAADPVRKPNPAALDRVWHAHILEKPQAHEAAPPQPGLQKQLQRLDEAREIARILAGWRATHPEPSKTAILVRNRAHLLDIIPALRQAGVPYKAIEIDALRDRQEVLDLLALTRALLHPADRVAWLAVLRAPWCGLALAQLHLLTGSDDPTRDLTQGTVLDLLERRGDLLDADSIARLERVWPILNAATALEGRLPLAQRVERTWLALGGDAYLTATERANANAFLQLLECTEQEPTQHPGTVELSLLERRLEKLFAAPDAQPGAVDLMTIHKSKGLEWDLVLLPALERIGARDRPSLLSWIELSDQIDPEDDAAHFLLAPIHGKGEESQALKKWIDGLYKERFAAERKRLFYVACTRAREELHLFAAPSRTAKGEVKPAAGTLLESAWAAAAPHFADPAQPAQPTPHPISLLPSRAVELAFEDDFPLSIAASAPEPQPPAGLLYRLPLDFDPAARHRAAPALPTSSSEPATPGPQAPLFVRPEGGLAARAFGNAVHAFLEQAALRLAAATPLATLIAELPTWTPRIAAVLRAEGLPPAQVSRLADRVQRVLATTLHHPEGAWLLHPHPRAASEFALTAWPTTDAATPARTSIRLDRLFLAGPEPLTTGHSHLWIVDYKTTATDPGQPTLDTFLAAQRTTYAPQLEAYARILKATPAHASSEIRLALYYPQLSRLLWWSL